MHDVAAAAGVSQATVSLVLNSASGSRFSEDTRKRVRDAVNRLGYRTNAHAKVLREGVAGMIGFIGDSVATYPFCRRHHRRRAAAGVGGRAPPALGKHRR